jgi:hypothetical protein
MIQRALVIATMLLITCALPQLAFGEEEETETGLPAFYPLVARRPVLEREIELHFTHEKASQGRTTTTSFGLDYVILPRWQLGLALPIVVSDPKGQSANAGIGDISLENTFLLYRGEENRTLASPHGRPRVRLRDSRAVHA